jgi:hypothetical protein
MTYEPREGDRVKVELVVGASPGGGLWLREDNGEATTLDSLIAAGKVELVSRAEPDWQPGDIGRDRETGELFRYVLTDPKDMPWVTINTHSVGMRRQCEDLAGRLDRMLLVPEGDDAKLASVERVTPNAADLKDAHAAALGAVGAASGGPKARLYQVAVDAALVSLGVCETHEHRCYGGQVPGEEHTYKHIAAGCTSDGYVERCGDHA